MLRRVRDFAQVVADGVITRQVADQALLALEVDHLGLDQVDRRMLRAIIENYIMHYTFLQNNLSSNCGKFVKNNSNSTVVTVDMPYRSFPFGDEMLTRKAVPALDC